MKTVTANFASQCLAGKVAPVYLAQLQITSGNLYLWTGIGNLSWNGQTWAGLGQLGSVSGITSVNDVSAQSITLMLTGIPSDLVNEAMNEIKQYYEVQIWFAFLDDTGTLVSTPVRVFDGHMDVPTITVGGDTSSIQITCENPLIALNTASNRIYTTDDQAIDYPGDLGFSFVPSIQEWNGVWGKAGAAPPPKSGTSTGGQNRNPRRALK